MAKAEPKETSERYIQRQVVTFLRSHAWYVLIASGSFKAMPGLAGATDLICFRQRSDGNAVVLFVECKAKGGKLRKSQEAWMKRTAGLLNMRNVYYMLAEAANAHEFLRLYGIMGFQQGFSMNETDEWK